MNKRGITAIAIATYIVVSIATGMLQYYGVFGRSGAAPLFIATLPLGVVGAGCEDSPFIPSSLGGMKGCPAWCDPWSGAQRNDYECGPRQFSLMRLVDPRPENPYQTACKEGGGKWRAFSDGCGDVCGSENAACTASFADACDCGSDACWAGDSCVAGRSAADR